MADEPRKDCFAYCGEYLSIPEHCNALYVLNCENCKFYKTVAEYKKGIEKYGDIRKLKW